MGWVTDNEEIGMINLEQGFKTVYIHFGICYNCKESNGANARNRYSQIPHLTQDTNGKVTNSK